MEEASGTEAKAYQTFINRIGGIDGSLNPADHTNQSEIKTSVNYDEQVYITGPFNITYTKGDEGGLTFGGITKMELEGGDFKIEKIILEDGSTVALFTPDPTEKIMRGIATYLSGKNFYVVYSSPSGSENVTKLNIEFKFMQAFCVEQDYVMGLYKAQYDYSEKIHCHGHWGKTGTDADGNPTYGTIDKGDNCCQINKVIDASIGFCEVGQKLIAFDKGYRELKVENLSIAIPPHTDPPTTENLQINISGKVWEDMRTDNKDNGLNGILDEKVDNGFNGVEVILYSQKKGESGWTEERRTVSGYNTTIDGFYEFKDLNALKKYYIEFIYNGQKYQATKFTGLVFDGKHSNGAEDQTIRNKFNEDFTEIKAAPNNYVVRSDKYKDILGYDIGKTNSAWLVDKYSIASSNKEIDEYSPYSHSRSKRKISDSECATYGIKEIYDFVMEQATKLGNYKAAYSSALSTYSSDTDIKSKLQFIEDSRIGATTSSNATYSLQTYPIENKFTEAREKSKVKYKGEYPAVYNDQLNVDFGINAREKADVALTKDVDKVTVEVNGKVHEYTYNTIGVVKCESCGKEFNIEELIYDEDTGEEKCPSCGKTQFVSVWDIGARNDQAMYMNKYTREIYSEDFEYKVSDYGSDFEKYGKKKSNEIEIFVTYKLMIANTSQSIYTTITEFVDYYDEDYKFEVDRSYYTLNGVDVNNGKAAFNVQDENKISKYKLEEDGGKSIYGDENNISIGGYDRLYITQLEDYKLSPGQIATFYLTFRVRKDTIDGEDWIRLDETIAETFNEVKFFGVGKENMAEINGYKTYYSDDALIPNVNPPGNFNKVAGLIDWDAVSGNIDDTIDKTWGKDNFKDIQAKSSLGNAVDNENLKTEEQLKEIYLRLLEDDSAKAPNIRIRLYRGGEGTLLYRTIDGFTWEDERLLKSAKAEIGNGIYKQEEDSVINGVEVKLIEVMENGTEFEWKKFYSGQNSSAASGSDTGVYTPVIREIGPGGIYGKIIVPDCGNTNVGYYEFRSYTTGNYVLRYVYGGNEYTVLPNTLEANGKKGWNEESYNGQDYKSTSYQVGMAEESTGKNKYTFREKEIDSKLSTKYNNNESCTYLYNITAAKEIDNTQLVSDAKDIMNDNNINEEYKRQNETLNSRQDVISYSDGTEGGYDSYEVGGVRNYIAEVLASHQGETALVDRSQWGVKLTELMQRTQMTAETGVMVIQVEYDDILSENQNEKNSQHDYIDYQIHNVLLGLQERPKSQLETTKEVANISLTLADGSVLFDASQTVTNVLWRKHTEKAYANWDNLDGAYENSHKNMLINDPMKYIRGVNEERMSDQMYGLAQLTMDEELMHGSTIKISYKITIRNIGEVDYKDNEFYYTGNETNQNGNIVKTTANQVVDYVANNLRYFDKDNTSDGWKMVEKEDLIFNSNERQDLVNHTYLDDLKDYDQIITNETFKDSQLTPYLFDDSIDKYSVSKKLVLNQLITGENDGDDLTYKNVVEIVKTSNEVGRRNAYSIVGNQNPKEGIAEIDADAAEIVKILPPYGSTKYIRQSLTGLFIIFASIVMITGIAVVRKELLDV